ncbi:phosphatidylinositol 4-kinase beta [Condylostylus longicornis]|uniref:phosphatidylinositol 4-kinase beta n=1 Tax=Condylostylus longicornis TaxID=2530218 RepID=UPI00244D9C3B|nr:phosphatidylinositol 4-kinase beta [Condylostylus longicornis]
MCSKIPINCEDFAESIITSKKDKKSEVIVDSSAKRNVAKKSRDIPSLRSNDSGIICGSESDQSSNRISHSHESLDSGEMDHDEECIEILETISMDEEYKMLQSDLCFYQQTSHNQDFGTLKSNKKSVATIAKEDEDEFVDQNTENTNKTTCDGIANVAESQQQISDLKTDTVKNITAAIVSESTKPENIKNEVLFKNFNFFGATKNAIFRTAQSIIENHEKKIAAKKTEVGNSSLAGEPSEVKSPMEITRKKEFFILKSNTKKSVAPPSSLSSIAAPTLDQQLISPSFHIPAMYSANSTFETCNEKLSLQDEQKSITKSISSNSLNKLKVPGVVKCFIKENDEAKDAATVSKTEKGPSGLLRFLESPIFNIHFAVHYLFYSKEPGVLSFIGNKIFSFPDKDVDLYIPQLIVMYIQMDELAEVLDPYLTKRCRSSVDFSLKCLWLLEAYNYQVDTVNLLPKDKRTHLQLIRELYSKKERKQIKMVNAELISPIKKTHHRSQSDATYLLNDSRKSPAVCSLNVSSRMPIYHMPLATPMKLCLGDLTSGRAFDNGCTCFESVKGTVNDLLGHKIFCCCGAPKTAPQKEFMKALINIGKNLTSLQTKAEKNSALRIFLNLINKNLPARVWLPLHSDDIPHHIVRISEEKTVVLNSKDKCPYIIYVEVVEVNDIYSSPVIMKLMPTLRHTKSEENLESKDSACSHDQQSIRNINETTKNSAGNSLISKFNSESCENCQIQHFNQLTLTEDDVWSQEDDDITAQYNIFKRKINERDSISQKSLDSDIGMPTLFNIGDVRTRHCKNLSCENTKPFSNDPEDPSAAALKEPWHEKEQQIRESSPYGHLTNWKLLAAIVKCGDDLRQELMATQLLEMFKLIWDEEKVDAWVRPYKIVCLSDDSGLIEPILNTVSLHQIKKNSNKSLRDYFIQEYGDVEGIQFKAAQKNFVQSCAGYCLISYLLQVKDRHNGNILLHSDGHLIHIDFGFILSISPKNLGFEQSPFKLTDEFVEVMGGMVSDRWDEFNYLLLKGLMAARKHMDRIINLVEIMRSNAQLPCFKNGCSGTVQNLRKRFHMNLTEQELERKVEQLVQDSLKSLSTKLYDGYQYFTNGIL